MKIQNTTIYIRADANETIGTGHVMRCLSIAEAIQKQGGEAIFLAADARTEDIVKNRGFSVICLNSVWNDLEKELEQLVFLVREKEIRVLLIDSYYVTLDYLETLHQYTKLVYIDDLDSFAYPVDMLISYAVYRGKADYENRYGNREVPDILSGSRYIPLKSRFCNLPERKISENVKNVLILTGGTDPYHVALELAMHIADAGEKDIAGAKAYKEQQFHIICGKYNRDYDKLCDLASSTENIAIYYNVDCMADYMMEADLAVTAGGTTTYELCACGTPSICYILADNQIQNARTLAEKGLMLFGGDVRKDERVSEIVRQLGRLSGNRELRQAMSRNMQLLVDGKGAQRIAEAVLNL